MLRYFRPRRPLGLLGAILLMATGCGGTAVTSSPSSEGASPAASPSGSVAASASSSPAIPQCGTLSIAFQSDIQHLDPAVQYELLFLFSDGVPPC